MERHADHGSKRGCVDSGWPAPVDGQGQQRPDHGQWPDLPCPPRQLPAKRLRSRPRQTSTASAASNSGGYEHAIQNAIDTPASNGTDLVVVYPGQPDLTNPRNNPRGAYYENLIIYSPVKLQGVGPGGFQGSTPSYPARSSTAAPLAATPRWPTPGATKIGGLTWDGNQDVNDGEAIYVLASQNANTTSGQARQFTSGFRASIDGFDIRGGDQQGFPGNINDLTGEPTGLPPGIVTQGGAIFANAYARYLQITNNVVQNNGGGYGTIRIGTPDLTGPDTNQHNENRAHRQQPGHRQRRHQPGGRHRHLCRRRQLRSGQQRHLRQLLARVRRRPQPLRLQPERQDPPQPHLLQHVERRRRRHHDRRPAAGRRRPHSRPAPARWTSTTTRSRPTWRTTTAAVSAS